MDEYLDLWVTVAFWFLTIFFLVYIGFMWGNDNVYENYNVQMFGAAAIIWALVKLWVVNGWPITGTG